MTNAEARFNKSLRPRKPEGSLGRTAQDVHLDSHTAPELRGTGLVHCRFCTSTLGVTPWGLPALFQRRPSCLSLQTPFLEAGRSNYIPRWCEKRMMSWFLFCLIKVRQKYDSSVSEAKDRPHRYLTECLNGSQSHDHITAVKLHVQGKNTSVGCVEGLIAEIHFWFTYRLTYPKPLWKLCRFSVPN